MRALIFGITVVAAVTFWGTAARGGLVHQWTFNNVNDGFGGGRDYVGNAHGTFFGSTSIVNGQLVLTGQSGAGRMTTGLTNQTIGESTLIAWLTNNSGNGAGVLSIGQPTIGNVTNNNAEIFNSIVFGEQTSQQWMNGSNNFLRTRNVAGGNGGAADPNTGNQVMMAITYSASGITLYRNGQFYANANNGPLNNVPFALHNFINPRFHIGVRHVNTNNLGQDLTPQGWFNGSIDEARVYNSALTAGEIQAIYSAGPVPVPEPSSFATVAILGTMAMVRRSRRRK
jgi:hypothetical protein